MGLPEMDGRSFSFNLIDFEIMNNPELGQELNLDLQKTTSPLFPILLQL